MQSAVHVVMGLRRSGKTTLVKRILTPPPNRLVVVDTLEELSRLGFVRGVDATRFCEILRSTDRYQVGIYPPDEATFRFVCDAAAARNDITLAIDEIDLWLPTATNLPPQSLLNMALTGGHYGQTLICVTHRPVSIHHSIMSQAILWVFPMFDSNDCAKVLKYTRRTNLPNGVDPADLQILRQNAEGWIEAVQVARVDLSSVQLLDFDLATGSLTE